MENTVAHVVTWVITGVRDRAFTSLPELARAISGRLEAYNAAPS